MNSMADKVHASHTAKSDKILSTVMVPETHIGMDHEHTARVRMWAQ